MNTSEEMGQDRDTRIHVIFSVLKIDNPHLAFATASYASRRNVREKKNPSVRISTSKLNFPFVTRSRS